MFLVYLIIIIHFLAYFVKYMHVNFNILKFEILSSSNDKAKELLKKIELKDFTVIITNEQTKGRGQRENSWHSNTGKNLTFSIITKPSFLKITNQFYLSKIVSLGILDYLNSKKDNFKVKWPNDIYYNNKKICGILIENSISGSVINNSIIGIGLNINQHVFPDYLPNAISLSNIKNKEYDLEIELDTLLNYIYKKYQLLKKIHFTEIDTLYHKYLYKINKVTNFKDKNGLFKGKIIGTMPEGKLIIKTSQIEIRTYNFKEVEFII